MNYKFLSKFITTILYVFATIGSIYMSSRMFYDISSKGIMTFISALPIILFICFLHFVSFRLFLDYLKYDR